MSDVELIPVRLDRGLATDGLEHELPLSETLNLVKPIGGAASGFEVRPGTSTFDTLSTGFTTADKGVVHLCELDTDDGYPPDSYLVVFQENVTGTILQIAHVRSTGGFTSAEYYPEAPAS